MNGVQNCIRRQPLLAVLLLITVLILSSTVVLAVPARQEAPGSEEGVAVERVQLDSKKALGDDPDEDGYAGEVPDQQTTPADSSEVKIDPSLQTAPIDWDLYMPGPQPDEATGEVSASSTMSPDWTDFRYVNVAGATLRPRASTTTWSYPGGGCISAAASNEIFNIHLPIPNGSRIDYLRIYYYDTSTNNSTAWLTTYDAAGGFTDLTSVSSSGTAGYGTSLSALVGHVVDTVNDSYVLNWRADQTGTTMRLCGLRVAYRDPS